jgi:hypothetical protein
MSSALLAKLKVKPIPKKIEAVEVVIPVPAKKEDVVIKTQIIDKRGTIDIDREAILEKIKSSRNYQGVTTIIPQKGKPVINISPVVEQKEEETVSVTVPKKEKSLKKKSRKALQFIIEEEEGKDETIKGDEEEFEIIPVKSTKKQKPKLVFEDEDLTELETEKIEIEKLDTKIKQDQKKEKKRRTKKPSEIVQEGPLSLIRIGDTVLNERLPAVKPKVKIQASDYYMNNRQIFINFISSLFDTYKNEYQKDKKSFSCERKDDGKFELLTHQNIVRDYINLYTPYRGLLLYHGLGSGKTCSSIAIAEGIKSDKQIIVMTPASLRTNYIESLKKCGDDIYKKKQYWEFISTANNPELTNTLSYTLSLPIDYIEKQKGAWLVNIKKKSNYDNLTTTEKESLDNQLNKMIRSKYKFINYNGIRRRHLDELTEGNTKNPFDNTVVIIDEVHNFVSRIVNKISRGSSKSEPSISMKLYQYIMDADNAKIVLLSGTPMINYPNEIAIAYNMIRGLIKTWYFKLNVSSDRKISQETLKELFQSKSSTKKLLDYIEYRATSTTLIVNRNPYGFIGRVKNDKYEGVSLNENGQVSDDDFVKIITSTLKKENITVAPNGIQVERFKALPDKLEDFQNYFIDLKDNSMKNIDMFKRRILGLTSYFRSIEELLPRYSKTTDFEVIKIPMSDTQFNTYEEARSDERSLEETNAKRKKKKKNDDVYEESMSTYRIFSRAFCNFVFPSPQIARPMPKENESILAAIQTIEDEDDIDAANAQEKIDNIDGRYEADEADVKPAGVDATYDQRIHSALDQLWERRDTYLSKDGLETYSPKFLHILENILDPEHIGIHLIYSQFRTLEGIGIISLVLKANGFAQFKIRKNQLNQWVLDIAPEDMDKPKFALYTGTETVEEKEIIRNIVNSDWKDIPTTIANEIKQMNPNNYRGEIIKTLMITASGAEGIDLKNIRYVHLTEPYWHPVRLEQVIGRAVRICSHTNLPVELQNVKVFLYIMTFTNKQITSDGSRELRLKDVSKVDRETPLTSDEALYEIATIKENISKQILKSIKETSIDCVLQAGSDNENLQCFSFGTSNPDKFAYVPAITEEEQDIEAKGNKKNVKIAAKEITLPNGISYALNKLTNELYELENFKRGVIVPVGRLQVFVDQETGKKKYKIQKI